MSGFCSGEGLLFFLYAVSLLLWNLSQVVGPVSRNCNQSRAIITERTESLAVRHSELSVGPLAVEVLGKNLLHEGQSIYRVHIRFALRVFGV